MKHLKIILLLTILLTACANRDVSTRNLPSNTATKPQPTSTPTDSVPVYTPAFEPAACAFQLPAGLEEGQDVECGYLVVPENRDQPDDRQIRLAVAIFHSPSITDNQVPTVYLEGGPGVSALKPLQYSFNKYLPFLQKGDLIIFDQRGVGLSQTALDCPEHLSLIDQSLEDHLTPEETKSRLVEVFMACHTRLLKEGMDFSMYNTRQSASDLADLRTALGIDAWDLFSVSYGTRLALEVMRQYPEGIRSVILDSVVPPQADPIAEASGNVAAALQAFFTTCQQDPGCQQSYPELETLLFELVANLNEAPVRVPITNMLTGKQYNSVMDGNTFLGVVIKSLYSSEILPIIPMMVYETAQGNYNKLSSLRSSFLTNAEFLSSGMYYSVICHEEAPFSNPDTVTSSLAQYPQLAEFFENSLTNSHSTFDFCANWNTGQAEELQNQAVESSIPTLVLAGQFDPSTPPTWSKLVADQLENSTYVEFRGIGHVPSLSHPCPNSIALAFLSNPSQKPDSSCAQGMKISFLLPQELTSLKFATAVVPEYGITTIAPEGWIAVKPEYYVSPDQTVELVFSKNSTDPLQAYLAGWGAGDSLGSTTINDLTWEVYPLALPDEKIAGYTAVSPDTEGFYFVLIIGSEEMQDSLYTYVFNPVLENFTLVD